MTSSNKPLNIAFPPEVSTGLWSGIIEPDPEPPAMIFERSSLPVPLAFGLLRLSSEGRPEQSVAIERIHQALEGGVRLLDTADSYCLTDKDFHYGEELAKLALDQWQGPREEVRILTKVGLTRPNGKWVPNGSPRHILRSFEASLKALGTEQIFLLQLHVRDPRTPFEETLACLAQLQQSGKVLHLGLCNVGPPEIRQALRFFRPACIQNELNVLTRKSCQDATLALAQSLNIPFLAHRPLGGHSKVDKMDKNRVLNPIATRHQASPREVALAALLTAGPNVLPLVGATRRESLQSTFKAMKMTLSSEDLAAIASKYAFEVDPEALATIAPRPVPADIGLLPPDQGPGETNEVVILMGIQGAGKSALVSAYEQAGYARLNRDLAGGKLEDLIPELASLLAQGQKRVVLDNTYPSRISRAPIVSLAHQHGVGVRCRWLKTPAREARTNIVLRNLERYGRLLGPEDFKELAKQDPNLPPPAALQRWMDTLEPPDMEEGFSALDELTFSRRWPTGFTAKGLLLDVDGTIRQTLSGEIYPRTPQDIEILPNRQAVLQRWIEAGYQLFFVSNQSGIASNQLSREAAQACFDRTVELLGLPIQEVSFCPHSAFPVGCYCRKPMPGQAIKLIMEHALDPQQLVMVGDMDSDEAFAKNIGAKYHDAADFFGGNLSP